MKNVGESRVRKPSQARSIAKKKRIVQTAYKLFDQKSYQAVSIRLIAREAGVSIGTIYSYFQDKKDIFIAVRDLYRDEMFARFLKLIHEELQESATLEEGIQALIQTLYAFFREHAILHRENIILTLMDEDHKRDHLVRERNNGRAIVDLFYDRFQDRISREKTEVVSYVVHRTVREVVQHQFLYSEDIDEPRTFREIAAMIAGYLR